jgi:hypothetical protein
MGEKGIQWTKASEINTTCPTLTGKVDNDRNDFVDGVDLSNALSSNMTSDPPSTEPSNVSSIEPSNQPTINAPVSSA